MDSKVLGLRELPNPQFLTEPVGEYSIEIPAGTTHYHLTQKESAAHIVFNLRERDSILVLTGVVDSAGQVTPSLSTEIIHHVPHTRAETRIRTLSRDQAAPSYSGMIRIEPGASSCESFLNHHSLLLGETAKSWTRPSLEILNNEVKCSHAATIRTLTDRDLFYLRSRGLSKDDARETLITAFLADVPH